MAITYQLLVSEPLSVNIYVRCMGICIGIGSGFALVDLGKNRATMSKFET